MGTSLKIGRAAIGYGKPVFIIAEAGVNHNGSLDLALKLVDAAARAGADAVKFQTFKAEEVTTRAGKLGAYQRRNLGVAAPDTQVAMLKKLELSESFYAPLLARCKKRGIIFLSTPHGGFSSVDFLVKLGVPALKFGSGDLTNLPLLRYAARFKKPMILGTGMATMPEVRTAIRVIRRAGNNKIVALHCTTNYPCPPREVNLRAMRTMMREPGAIVGYSDHTLGDAAPVAAVTLGACVIEKHLTLNRDLPGPDHRASATPGEFTEMTRRIRALPIIMGSAAKAPTAGERPNIPVARKSIVATALIKKGDRLTGENIGIKRPGTGLAPMWYDRVIGKRARRDIVAGALIRRSDF